MNIIFFGFTGLGSAVLKGLLSTEGVNVISVYTKKYDLPYPYYDEMQISEICSKNNVSCFFDLKINEPDKVNRFKKDKPDLIVVASFSTIISPEVLNIPLKGVINFHPSLLPKYKGPYPDQAVILNGEKKTGVTVHYVTDKIDSGNILMQKSIIIEDSDNYSSLKKKLADTAESMIHNVIELFKDKHKPEGDVQDESKSSYFPKPSEADCCLNNLSDLQTIIDKIRALNPYPGTFFVHQGEKIFIDNYELIHLKDDPDQVMVSDKYIEITAGSSVIRLFKKK